MEEQIFLDNLVRRYLSNNATMAELEVFLHLLKQGKLNETMSRMIDAQIAADSENNEAD